MKEVEEVEERRGEERRRCRNAEMQNAGNAGEYIQPKQAKHLVLLPSSSR